jgi:hypothetical protein
LRNEESVFKIKFGHAFFFEIKQMSKEKLEEFCLLVLGDPELRKQLQDISERDEFMTRVIELGARNGFEIMPEDVEEKIRENRRLWHERWI